MLYPPHVTPPAVYTSSSYDGGGESLTSLQWLLEVYPTLSAEQRPIDFLQEPGEVVFVPGGE